jgi:hypothetical protein
MPLAYRSPVRTRRTLSAETGVGRAGERGAAAAGMVLRTPQEPPIDRPEYQDNPDVYYQPRPEVMPEEQDVCADHDACHREHVKHDDRLFSHGFVLLCATDRSKSGNDERP